MERLLLQCFIIYRHQIGELNNRTDFTQEPSCCPTQNFMFSLRSASRILKHPAEDVEKARGKESAVTEASNL